MVKNLFITGGLGQDGRIICKLLKRKKLNINIITKSKEVNVNKKINYIISNLLNKKKIEAIFKAFAKAIKAAVKRDLDKMILPSTKGSL